MLCPATLLPYFTHGVKLRSAALRPTLSDGLPFSSYDLHTLYRVNRFKLEKYFLVIKYSGDQVLLLMGLSVARLFLLIRPVSARVTSSGGRECDFLKSLVFSVEATVPLHAEHTHKESAPSY